MTTPDLINGLFEVCGSLFILKHCSVVLKDKAVAGVSIMAVTFFSLWGFWNVYYYPHLDQWLSFSGGIAIVVANTLWVYLLLKYRKPKEDQNLATYNDDEWH